MTSAQRKALRNTLIDRGFRRGDYTMDDGFGRYEETFFNKNGDKVVISWEAREHR